ncbi:coiled-coil domain-containing protein [Rhodopirellula baltica]
MATNLNALVMKISADTSGLAEGVRLTRSEISRLNRIQQMAKTDSDKLKQSTEALQKGFAAGAIDAVQLQKGLDEVRKRYGSTSQAARDHAAAVERGLAVVRQTEPAIEAIKNQFRDLMAAQKAGKVSAEEYARAKASLIDQTKKLKDAEFAQSEEGKRLAAQQREAEQQTRRVRQQVEASIAPADRLERQIQELNQEYRRGNVNAADYARTQNRLQKELNETNQAARKQSQALNLVAGSISGLTAGYVAVRALNALRDSISGAMEEIDNTAKQSKKLGILTDELVGLRMAAAEYSGFTSGQFDTSMQRMTRRIAEAANGTGEAQDAIKSLRLDAKQLAQDGPAEAFRKIADRMSQVENRGERLRLAFKLFDSEGAGLVTTLAEGRNALDDVQKSADRLGTTFTNIEAAQIEAANDALLEARTAVDGMIARMAIALAPTIQAIAKDMGDVALSMRSAGMEVQQLSYNLAVTYGLAKDLANALLAIRAAKNLQLFDAADYAQTAFNLENSTQAAIDAANGLAKAYAEAAKMKTGIDTEGVIADEANSEADRIQEEIERLRERNLELKNGAEWYARYQEQQKANGFNEDASPEQKQLMETLRKQNAELEKAAKLEKERLETVKKRVEEDNKNRQEIIDRGNEYLESLKTPMQNLTDQLVQAELEFNKGGIDWEQWQNAQMAAEDQFRNANDQPIKIELPPVLKRDSAEEYRMVSQMVTGQRNEQQRQHNEAMQLRRAHLTAMERVESAINNIETAEAV